MGKKKLFPGREFNAFMREWPVGDSWYIEDCDVDEPLDGELYSIESVLGLALCWQGRGAPPESVDIGGIACGVDVESRTMDPSTVFNAWLKSRTHRVLVVDVPKEREEEFRALIVNLGCTVQE